MFTDAEEALIFIGVVLAEGAAVERLNYGSGDEMRDSERQVGKEGLSQGRSHADPPSLLTDLYAHHGLNKGDGKG